MAKTFGILKGVVSLAFVAFLVMLVVGLYTALDSATAAYGDNAVEEQVEL